MLEGQEEEAFTREAIAEAQSVDERCVYPNPRVGAVIVENGAIGLEAGLNVMVGCMRKGGL